MLKILDASEAAALSAPADEEPLPTIDCLLFDNLTPNQTVLIDGKPHLFFKKMEGEGPHLLINHHTGETARLTTTRLIELFQEGRYYNPLRKPPLVDEKKAIDETRALIGKIYHTLNAKPRGRAAVIWRYVGAFINEMLIAPPGKPFYQNHENAETIIEQVDGAIDRENLARPEGN
jgi:putative transposase